MAAIVVVVLVVFALPAFVAYRYTAPEQRSEFLTHPWRGWTFALAALAVPGDAELKTSGMALRKADWVFKGTAVDPREVQLLFVPEGKPYTFNNAIDGRTGHQHGGAQLPLHLAGPGRHRHRLRQNRHNRGITGLRRRGGVLTTCATACDRQTSCPSRRPRHSLQGSLTEPTCDADAVGHPCSEPP